MVTNLSTGFSEVYSHEKHPGTRIADAVRYSMSIPFFFAAKQEQGDVYTDGGVLDNYPVKLFDREKYLTTSQGGKETDYYKAENSRFLAEHPKSSPYIFNKETLGFRLDSEEEIAMFRDQAEPPHHKIGDLFAFIYAVVKCFLDSQDNQHLHSDDWQRTIYINTLGVGTTDFAISDAKKQDLVDSGRKGAKEYFDWYDGSPGAVNKPESEGRIALNINFDTGRATWKPNAIEVIAEIVYTLESRPQLRVKLEGHTDNVGDAAANKKLSDDRANAVMNAIIGLGIDKARLSAEGFGQEYPIADNNTEEGRTRNRRVELVMMN